MRRYIITRQILYYPMESSSRRRVGGLAQIGPNILRFVKNIQSWISDFVFRMRIKNYLRKAKRPMVIGVINMVSSGVIRRYPKNG